MKKIMATFTEFVYFVKLYKTSFISFCFFIFIVLLQHISFHIAGKNESSSEPQDRAEDRY